MTHKYTPGWLKVQPLDDDDHAAQIMQVAGDPYPMPIADVYSAANARRLVACWNALDGISTTEIETAARCGSISHALAKVIKQRDELLDVLKGFHMWAENQSDAQSKGGHATFDLWMLREQRDLAATAIAKATGEPT